MSLRVDYEPHLSDRDRDAATYAAEDERWCSGPLECDCGQCPACLPELYDVAELVADRREERAA